MAIKRKIEWDRKKIHCYVDFGGDLDTDEVPEAKEALVFLVTGINANWKVTPFILVNYIVYIYVLGLIYVFKLLYFRFLLDTF